MANNQLDQPTEVALFIDESGNFEEKEPSDASADRTTAPEPSQVVGFLARNGTPSESEAEAILSIAHRAAGLELGPQVHGTEIKDKDAYDRLIRTLVDHLNHKGWQPVRLENATGVGHGNPRDTYLDAVTELAIRTLEALDREKRAPRTLKLCAAIYNADHSGDDTDHIFTPEYEKRIRSGFTRSLGMRGIRQGRWTLGQVRTGSGKKDRRLQICDLLSNASFRNYRRCSPDTRDALQDLFGDFDHGRVLCQAGLQAQQLLALGAPGLGLRILGEFLAEPDLTRQSRQEAQAQVSASIAALAEWPANARDIQLRSLIDWVRQIIEHARQPKTALAHINWILNDVLTPLQAAALAGTESNLAWFAVELRRWEITAHNHLGDLVGARRAMEASDALLPAIAGRWEHSESIVETLVIQGVHLTDCFEFETVESRLLPIAENYGGLARMLSDALPGIAATTIRSELLGKILGTLLQSEIYRGWDSPERLATARDLSDRALQEFTLPEDTNRQRQYRAQLEATAGNFDEACRQLALSLGSEESSHAAIGARIMDLELPAQGFPLLHWTRIGRIAANRGAEDEVAAAAEALLQHPILDSAWVSEENRYYPAHGIRRNLATILAAYAPDRIAQAKGCLKQLRRLAPATGPLAALEMAAIAEAGSLIQPADPKAASGLLAEGQKDRPDLLHLLKSGPREFPNLQSLWDKILPLWSELIPQVLDGNADARRKLLHSAGQIGY